MTDAAAGSVRERSAARGFGARVLRGLGGFASGVVRVLLVGWGALALFYRVPAVGHANVVLALAFVAFSAWALWRAPRRRGWLAFAVVFAVLLGWYSTIRPQQDRDWRADVARPPRAVLDGDLLTIHDFRNFEWRSRDDFTPRYETRTFDLRHLTGVDFYVSYWSEGPVGHTFLSFIFDNADPLSISIETRPEAHEGFDPLASLFRQFELIYVVGDERDIVGVRTGIRHEDVYLYHVNMSAAAARALLRVYVERINELAARPEFYNLLSNSCTINIIRYANRVGRAGRLTYDQVLNGWIDRYLYRTGLIDTSLPFWTLRERSHVNAAANAAGDSPDFWQRIRAGLPGGTRGR
ncbi:MAG: DUF4105 domain-containing protein [Proteobacteria bacterium]|nr:DUF4105 domain-containing protein [Pseudomonadota bacterium]